MNSESPEQPKKNQDEPIIPPRKEGSPRRTFLKKTGYFTFALTIVDGIVPLAQADFPNMRPCAQQYGMSAAGGPAYTADDNCPKPASGATQGLPAQGGDGDCGLKANLINGPGSMNHSDGDCPPSSVPFRRNTNDNSPLF